MNANTDSIAQPTISRADVLLVTATRVESLAVLAAFREATGHEAQFRPIGDKTYHDLGIVGGAHVFMVLSEMGTGGVGGSQSTVAQGIQALRPSAVIMVGIAYGLRSDKQKIGDILISKQLQLYELQKVGVKVFPRGDKPQAAPALLDRFRNAELTWKGPPIHFGLILSGDKLVANAQYREELRRTFGEEAIGGEMEGAGLYVAAQESKTDWIIVKAICDWGDEHKDDTHQKLAADNASKFVVYVLKQGGLAAVQGRSIPSDIEQGSAEKPITIAKGSVAQNINASLLGKASTRNLAILAFILVVALWSVYAYFESQKRPAPMTGGFNIAVAQFGQVMNDGSISSSQTSAQISKALFDFLDSEYKNFGLDVQVAHAKIGIISENREAEELAETLHADIVIYGSVFVEGNEAIVYPKFYVSDQPDAYELTGTHQLAEPIVFNLSSLKNQVAVNLELQSRAFILVQFTKGLTYLSAKDFPSASGAFAAAINKASRQAFEGQETLYLFAAHAMAFQNDFDAAHTNLDLALDLNPAYARAYLGRGNIYYTQYRLSQEHTELLDWAIAEYEEALQASDEPDGAYVKEKAYIGLGNVYVVRAQQTNDPALYTKAIEFYEKVVPLENSNINNLRELAALAYFGLGVVYERQAELAQAAEAYRKCYNLTRDPDMKSRVQERLDAVKNPDNH